MSTATPSDVHVASPAISTPQATPHPSPSHPTDWLFSKPLDLWVLFAPVWLVWAISFTLPQRVVEMTLPLWMWVVIVLCIDVSHVWSTIYRTYLDRDERRRHGRLLLIAPLACLSAALLIATTSITAYWRVMAYLALYHFIKQQYGFLALYGAKLGARRPARVKWLQDKPVIYLSMLYPVLYWHLNRDDLFGWFTDGDFFTFAPALQWLSLSAPGAWLVSHFYTIANALFWLLLLSWLAEEVWTHRREHLPLPTGKILWLLTTGINWYLGIVYFSSELVFSMTNMVAHGIPYLALIFFYVQRKKDLGLVTPAPATASHTSPPNTPRVFSSSRAARNVALMFGFVLLIAFIEEYFWDMLVNRDKSAFFERVLSYPTQALDDSGFWTAFTIAVLSLPQLTHYILDGYIWKGPNNPHLKKILTK
jgi:hypothetical protein